MGCSASRIEVSPVEAQYINGESELLYSSHNVTEVDYIHRKYSFNGEINENQWMNIYRNLNLSLNQSGSPIPEAVIEYYNQYKSGSTFKLRDLLVVGILLSIGTVEVKAKLLFDAFDYETNHELSREDLGLMLEVMYRICVKRAEIIVKQQNDGKVTAEEHKEYLRKMSAGKELFKEKFMNDTMKDRDNVTLKGFLVAVANSEYENIFTTSGFRTTLKKFGMTKKNSSEDTSVNS